MALMGPSGAGKTTLLNSIVGRTITGLTEGGIYLRWGRVVQSQASWHHLGKLFFLDAHLNGVQARCTDHLVTNLCVQPPLIRKPWRSSVGYVTQDDIMYETLTPRENLTFAAAFILPKLSKESRQKEVDD